jgi:catechol 2,3-dioxygenase
VSTSASDTAHPAAGPGGLSDALRLGPVHLTVTNLDRSVAFYQDAIGLRLHRRDDPVAAMGAGGDDLIVLVERQTARRAGRHAGLYHVALLYPSRVELARALQRLAATRTPIEGASDHGISEAIYLPDPDGNGLELAADRPREVWPSLDTIGAPQPLDLRALLGIAGNEEPRRHADPALVVGHVHLHVSDIQAARRFYEEVVGFEAMTAMPNAVFVSVGGYHHHLAFNTWRGVGVPSAPPADEVAGLRHWTIVLRDGAELDGVRARALGAGADVAGEDDAGLLVRDPAGNAVLLTVAAPAPPAAAGAHLRGRAEVATGRPSPYLLQVAKHFRHKLDVTFDEREATIEFAFGRANLRAEDGVLVLEAVAAGAEELDRVQHVIGSHLERFGRRDELTVTWSPAPG